MIKTEEMNAVELSDADLVAESLSGDRDAFGKIVERYQTLIASLAYCTTGDVSQSEDLAQETFVSAWKDLAQLREPAKLRPWLCSIARFLISKELRRKGREPIHQADSLDTLNEWTSPEPLPPEHAISQEELSLLWRSLEGIPPTYREPLVLFYREHQSIEAVANGLGLSEDAVKQRLSRGRKFLQDSFMAFVAEALDQSRPGKTFALSELAALPLLGATAKAATVGTAIAKHGGVAAKTTSSGGFLQAISCIWIGMAGWVAGALSVGGYIGYKMGGDRQNSERARRSVATFWRIMGISMFCLLWLPLILALFLTEVIHLHPSQAQIWKAGFSYLNVALPIFMFGVVPLTLVVWIWQRRRPAAPAGAVDGGISSPSRRSINLSVGFAMIIALLNLGAVCWIYSLQSRMPIPKSAPETRYVSTSEVQRLIANSKDRNLRLTLRQRASGARTLYVDLDENTMHTSLIAPAENSTLALLAENGLSYETKIDGRDFPGGETHLAWWAHRLLEPFYCFIVVAGAVTLLRGRRQSEQRALVRTVHERRLDLVFAALAACGMLAVAIALALTTDWKVHRIAAGQVPNVVVQHSNARFEVFECYDGSRKLWISEHHTPDFIAPADESTLGLLKRQGIAYQTYMLGAEGFPGRSQFAAVLWIFGLSAAAGGLFWWTVKDRWLPPIRFGRNN